MHVPAEGKVKPYPRMVQIGEVAALSAVSAKTIRYYEQIGLLASPERSPSGYRLYEHATVERLSFIKAAQAVGFSLDEIRTIIDLRDGGIAPCAHVLALVERHTEEVAHKVAALTTLKAALEAVGHRGANIDPHACRPGTVCDVIPLVTADDACVETKRAAVESLRRTRSR